MNKLEQYAERIEAVQGRCDGGRDYPWRQAVDDMSSVLRDIKQCRPRTRGNQLIRRLLMTEAEMWLSIWSRKG